STRRPLHMSSTKKMHMKMINFLTTIITAIQHKSETSF
ncbi:MAG: hypothetical protein AMXMBFR51_10530, partial [Ignavibacteriota bacterium]